MEECTAVGRTIRKKFTETTIISEVFGIDARIKIFNLVNENLSIKNVLVICQHSMKPYWTHGFDKWLTRDLNPIIISFEESRTFDYAKKYDLGVFDEYSTRKSKTGMGNARSIKAKKLIYIKPCYNIRNGQGVAD